MYPHDLKCPTNISRPEFVGICQRCNQKRYFRDLTFQHDWRGNSIQSLNFYVCPECNDKPQEQLRPVIVGPDSLPPRPWPSPPDYMTDAASSGPTLPGAQLLPFSDQPLSSDT